MDEDSLVSNENDIALADNIMKKILWLLFTDLIKRYIEIIRKDKAGIAIMTDPLNWI
jgi:hypothetical protein